MSILFLGPTLSRLENLGTKIRTLRQLRGLSQAALGQRINVSQKEISHYEKNYRTPPFEMLSAIARVLETPIGDFYNEPAKTQTDTGLKKSTIWLIAERLELLDESEHREVLAYIDRMVTAKKPSLPG